MSSTILQATLTVGPLAAGASVTIDHGLRIGTRGVIPNKILPDRATPIAVSTVTVPDIEDVTFTNTGADGEEATFLVQYDISQQQAADDPPVNLFWRGLEGGSVDPGAFGMLVAQRPYDGEIYVDGDNGDDNNDGLTPETALATLGGVYAKFPLWVFNGGALVVNLAGVGGFGADATDQIVYDQDSTVITPSGGGAGSTYVYRGPDMVPFTPATGPATAAFDATPAVLVGLRTRFDFTTAAPGWTVNNLAGAFLRITRAGALVQWELPISTNTADTIFVDTVDLVGTILNTDTAEIVIPGARIEGPADRDFGYLGFSGIAGQFTDYGDTNSLGGTFTRIEFGPVATSGVTTIFDRCKFTDNTILSRCTVEMVNCAAKSASTGRGLAIGGTFSVFQNPQGGAPIDGEPRVCLTCAENVHVELGMGPIATPGACDAFIDYPISVYSATLGVAFGAFMVGSASGVYFSGSYGNLLGASNASYGAWAIQGGRLRITAANTTITGTSGSLRVGAGAAVAYGVGAGQFSEVAGFNGNLHRLGGSTATVPVGDMSQITTITA